MRSDLAIAAEALQLPKQNRQLRLPGSAFPQAARTVKGKRLRRSRQKKQSIWIKLAIVVAITLLSRKGFWVNCSEELVCKSLLLTVFPCSNGAILRVLRIIASEIAHHLLR